MGKLLNFFSKSKNSEISALVKLQVSFSIEIEELKHKLKLRELEISKLLLEVDELKRQLDETMRKM